MTFICKTIINDIEIKNSILDKAILNSLPDVRLLYIQLITGAQITKIKNQIERPSDTTFLV